MLYRHYKGGLYRTLSEVAYHSETGEEMVVYISVETGKVWVRPSRMFDESVLDENDEIVPRFKEVSE
ncbi:DUF1653 domain-containing protein [Bacillus cereus group sp. RP32]|uniref:DUF1653 domain-containing protein n=1 Tax=Bacillus cereus group TaxID=86661 RepID=UPI000279C65F|nr:hypothetical protein IIO_06238 [Bacillus cereus VD115]EJR52592.1 hypothetical protein IIO_06164 [Bacillus cereus VD115]